MDQAKRRRQAAGLAAGVVAAVALALVESSVARAVWPAYAAAEPDKAFTLAMLIARLAAGASCAAAGGWIATCVARDRGGVALVLGAVLLAGSLPIHLYFEWRAFPVWYHAVYLTYLVPIAGVAGRVAARGG